MNSSLRLYVLLGVWHIVDGAGVEIAPKLGAVYLTKCYRWLRAYEVGHDLARGSVPPADDICKTCDAIAAKALLRN